MPVDSREHSGWVRAMAVGDERAAAKLYDEFGRIMFLLALRIVGESADAEEVVLEAFVQAWSGATSYKHERSSVMSWLAMMTRTRALDCVRARSRRARAVADAKLAMVDESVATAGEAVSVVEHIEEAERATAVVFALKTLASPQRIAIELAFYRGLTHPEIAEFLGEPLGTIKTRIRLGMQRMRNVLTASHTLTIRTSRGQQ